MQLRLMEYHIWATERLLLAIERLTAEQFNHQVESSFPSIRETLAHMLVVDYIWLGQVGISVDGLDLAEIQALAEPAAVRSVWQRLAPALHEGAATLDPQRSITAQTYTGSFESTVGEILHHITNHGTYHRGQLTTMLRQVGAKPPQQIDAIHYYRQHPIA